MSQKGREKKELEEVDEGRYRIEITKEDLVGAYESTHGKDIEEKEDQSENE